MVIDTVQDMHIAVEHGVQNVGMHIHDDLQAEEIDYVLNLMQNRVITDRVFPESDPKKMGIQDNQKRLDDIRKIIIPNYIDAISPRPVSERAVAEFGLPRRYKYRLSTKVKIQDHTCGGKVVAKKLSMEKDSDNPDNEDNPFARSNVRTAIRGTMAGNYIRVPQTESYTVIGLEMRYVRIPREISLSLQQDCELPQHVKEEIVALTIKHFLENIESQRYQSNSVEESQQE